MQYSEYQKKYRPVGPRAVESHYAQLLAYRRARRSTEAAHHSWAWDDDSSESESKADEESPLTDVEERSEEEEIQVGKDKSLTTNGVAANGIHSDCEEEAIEARLKSLALQKAREKEREMTQPRKPRHPRNRVPIPKPVSSKEPPQESSKMNGKKQKESRESPMFELYGRGNREGRATFNVRSDRDVRPSALRANRRRQAEIERRRQARVVAPARPKRSAHDPSVDLAKLQMQRETAAWQSEYRKNYPSYELACYRRSRANLTPRPVSAMI